MCFLHLPVKQIESVICHFAVRTQQKEDVGTSIS